MTDDAREAMAKAEMTDFEVQMRQAERQAAVETIWMIAFAFALGFGFVIMLWGFL